MSKRNDEFIQRQVDKFIDSLCSCLYAGDVELNIKFDVEQKDNVLYFNDGKHKYRLTVDYEGKA